MSTSALRIFGSLTAAELINILSAEEFSLEAYSSTKRDRIKVADNFVYENIETKGQWKDSKGQYGLVFCHGNIVSENNT